MYKVSLRHIILALFLLFVAGLSTLSACGSEGDKTCKRDSECSKTQRCKNKLCVPRANCRTKADCLAQESCINQRCMPGSGPVDNGCETDGDCAPQWCDSGSGKCVACTKDEHCQQGQRCDLASQQCSSGIPDAAEQTTPDKNVKPGECGGDGDCKAHEMCDLFTKKCKIRTGQPCTTDANCRGATRCEANKCVAGRRDCSTNPSACQKDYTCRSGLCYKTNCQTDQDCETGKTCNKQFGQCTGTAFDCTQTGCKPGETCNTVTKQCDKKTGGCASDADCPAGKTCDLFTKTCKDKQPPGCKSDSDCTGGQICNTTSGKCENKPDCTTLGCPSGQVCDSVTKKCKAKGSGCASNADCSAPTGTCHQGKCQSCASQFNCPGTAKCDISTGICKSTCTTDAQCAAPTGTCHGSQCKSCAKDFSCQSGQKCDAASGRCKSTSCTSNTQCPSTQYCSNRACVPKQCNVAGKTCPTGQRCSNFQCIPNSTTPPRRTSCTSNLICSALSKGTCLLFGPSQGICVDTCRGPGSACKSGLTCTGIPLNNGTTGYYCLAPPSRTTGQTCNPFDLRCTNNGSCLDTGSIPSVNGKCFAFCKPTTVGGRSTCSVGQECVAQDTAKTKGVCVTASKIRTAGSTCNVATLRCQSHLLCVNISATSRQCLKKCTPPSSTQCRTGTGNSAYTRCRSLTGGGGVCYRP